MNSEELAQWMTRYIAKGLKIQASSIRPDVVLSDYGVDSVFAVLLSGELADLTGLDIAPNILYEFPTVGQLSDHLAAQLTLS